MTFDEFYSLGLESGDKVRVKIGSKRYVGYFGGYKMFDGIGDLDNHSLFPVFYAAGKDGQMVRRSLVPDRSTWWGLSDIASCEKITVPYRHVGYYNNQEDCESLAKKGFTAALEAWKKNEGAFYNVDNNDIYEDVENDDQTCILEDGKYAVRFFDIPDGYTGDPDNYPGYIDIFERVGDLGAALNLAMKNLTLR